VGADMCNAVVEDGNIPEDWSTSWLASVQKVREKR